MRNPFIYVNTASDSTLADFVVKSRNSLIPVKQVINRNGRSFVTTVYKRPEEMKPIWRDREILKPITAANLAKKLNKENIFADDIHSLSREERNMLFSAMSRAGVDMNNPIGDESYGYWTNDVARALERLKERNPNFLNTLHPNQKEAEEQIKQNIKTDLINNIKRIKSTRNWTFKDKLEQIDSEVLNDTIIRLETLDNKYQALSDVNFTLSSFAHLAPTAGAFTLGSFNSSVATLSLAPYLYHNKNKAEISALESDLSGFQGWNMPCNKDNAFYYTVTHEYGHLLCNSCLRQDAIGEGKAHYLDLKANLDYKEIDEWENNTLMRYCTEIKEIAKDLCSDEYDIEDGMYESGYLRSCESYPEMYPKEFFAECFANLNCGKPNPLGQALGVWLKRRMNK